MIFFQACSVQGPAWGSHWAALWIDGALAVALTLFTGGFQSLWMLDAWLVLGLGDWLERNPGPARDVIRKAISAAQARMAARKARDNARRKSPLESFGMPGKLSDCSSKNPEKCEVYIVEGDSAGGSAKRGRNPETQAILPCAERS